MADRIYTFRKPSRRGGEGLSRTIRASRTHPSMLRVFALALKPLVPSRRCFAAPQDEGVFNVRGAA